MNTVECVREREIMEVVACGRWPGRCPEELLVHTRRCAICTDAVEVAVALREDYDLDFVNSHIPPAGLVWWRAELRARQDAMRTVSRPMTLVQTFGGACAVGVVVAVLTGIWPTLKESLLPGDLLQLDLSAPIDMAALTPLLTQWGMPLALAIALALVIVAPVAMYLVWSGE